MNGLTKQKLKRKLFEIVKENIPCRTTNRPIGIHNSPSEASKRLSDQGVEYHVVLKEYLTELPLKKQFFKKVASYTIYDQYKEVENDSIIIYNKSDYGILKIPKGRIYSNNIDYIAVITPDNRIVENVSYQYKVDRKAGVAENKILKQKYFIKPNFIDATVFSLLSGYGATHNIAHWFFDSIPRIHLLKESGLFEEIDYFLVPAYKYDYHIDSLKLLGIPKEKIIVGKEDTHLMAKNLVVSSHPRSDRSFLLPLWITEFLRKEYLTPETEVNNYPKRIFISRKDSSLRRIVNEDEVVAYLRKHHFESILLSKYPFLEKVKLFRQAEIIISSSGAGLACLFFADKKAKLVEIFPEGFVDTHFYNIAYHLGLDYYPIICKSDKPAKDMEEGQKEDIKVDMRELESSVNQLLKPS